MPRRVLTDDQAADIARRLAAGKSNVAVAAVYGVSEGTIRRLRRRMEAGEPLYRSPLQPGPRRPVRVRRPFAGHAALSPQIRELGTRLRALREARHMPRSMVGGKVGIDGDYLLTVERGRARPSPAVLRRLAEALGGNYDELARLVGYE